MDQNLTEFSRAVERDLSMLKEADSTQLPAAMESLGVTDETYKALFSLIIAFYKRISDTQKAAVVDFFSTIAPYSNAGICIKQLPQPVIWEIIIKGWKIVELFPHVQAWDKIRHLLAIVWRDEFARDIPLMFKEAIIHLGFTPAELPTVSLEEFSERIRDNKPQTSLFDRIYLALDLIFEARYNWPQGTARTKCLRKLLIALEHALEFTPEGKPSIWEIT